MTPLIVIHGLICVFLVFVILLQPGKSDGGGIGFGSSSQSIFGSRGAGNFLTKLTTGCAFIFLLTSFILTRSRMAEYNRSVIRDSDTTKEAPAKAPPTENKPAAPNLEKKSEPAQK